MIVSGAANDMSAAEKDAGSLSQASSARSVSSETPPLRWDPNVDPEPVVPCDGTSPLELKQALSLGNAGPLVTLIFTTSPVPCNPDTYFMENTLASYTRAESCLKECEKILVCDGFLVREQGKSNDYRRGRVDGDAVQQYQEYVERLQALCEKAKVEKENDGSASENAFYNTRVLALERRHGFAHAVRRALIQVKTPFVMVIQHDRVVKRPFQCISLLENLLSWRMRNVNYICLGTSATWNSPMRTVSEFKFDVRDYAIDVLESAIDSRDECNARTDPIDQNNQPPQAPNSYESKSLIVPMVFWYDSTHICRTDFYRRFAFGDHFYKDAFHRMKAGEFIEDKLGNILRSQTNDNGMAAHLRFGTYLLVQRDDQSLDYPVSECSQHPTEFYNGTFGKVNNAHRAKTPKSITDRHIVIQHLNQRKLLTLHRLTNGEATQVPGAGKAIGDAAALVEAYQSSKSEIVQKPVDKLTF